MVTIDKELRLVNNGDAVLRFELMEPHGARKGISLQDFAKCDYRDAMFSGYNDVLNTFRATEKSRSIPLCVAGAATGAAGIVSAYLNKNPVQCASLIVSGVVCAAMGIFHRHTMMFQDCKGNVVDLFLGIVYVGGTNYQRYLHFSHFAGGDGSGF